MTDLRLGTNDLAPKDVAYVRALVRLFAHTEKLNWSFADALPYHAVVTRSGAPADFAGVVLTLAEKPASADSIAYPVRANQFRDWLKLRHDSLLGEERQVASAPVENRSDNAAVTGPRFKLRRWPGPEVLKGDPMAMRMATFMSRNALSVQQMAALTGQAEEACGSFVARLRAAGLLVELVELAPTASSIDVPAPAAPARMGLMASLRRHLGL